MSQAYMTRQCRETELEQLGVTGQAMECLLSETAEERHLSRVAYAKWAAEEYYLTTAMLERGEVSQDTLTLMAGAILWADIVGIGGRDGVEGAATTRHPAFSNCGKGRKQASDGGAWSAAIYRAALDCAGCFRVNSIGVLVYSQAHSEAPPNETMLDGIVPNEWVYSILREGLRRSVGRDVIQRCWHGDVPFNAPTESITQWVKLVNNVVNRMSEEVLLNPSPPNSAYCDDTGLNP